ncbi:hypothetical protein GXB85_05385 [Cellulomonas sp. APG4]|uniref:hypothetical protein n=1 Tax=Cellulomonas sp. APG4 TaxID=1538656 RepID=UPI00137B7A6E|nr:hypothetical protein [Cellulomonas sp. APG4]NCT90384.1 hypothetical protein [Cellulomonas sp. APG4]
MPEDASLPTVVASLASWSRWQPFTPEVIRQAPVLPGVYLFQQDGALVYVGRAGERSGKGLRGRLTIYVSGRAPHSGLGNLALERALQEPSWLRERLEEVEAGQTLTVQQWSRLAVERAALRVCWSTTSTTEEGAVLERAVLDVLKEERLWNRLR